MRVPLLDLSQQYAGLAGPIRAEIEEVLATQHFILGPKVETFERELARYCGSPHAIGVSSGTDALLAVFMAMGLGPGDVVVDALSRYATAGVTDLCVRFVGDDQQAQLARFTAEVLPALRA